VNLGSGFFWPPRHSSPSRKFSGGCRKLSDRIFHFNFNVQFPSWKSFAGGCLLLGEKNVICLLALKVYVCCQAQRLWSRFGPRNTPPPRRAADERSWFHQGCIGPQPPHSRIAKQTSGITAGRHHMGGVGRSNRVHLTNQVHYYLATVFVSLFFVIPFFRLNIFAGPGANLAPAFPCSV